MSFFWEIFCDKNMSNGVKSMPASRVKGLVFFPKNNTVLKQQQWFFAT